MKLKDIDKYINREDWRVKENSNASFSYAGLQGYIAGADIANYTLEKIYTPEISQAHKDCFIHLHDLSNGIVGYCAGWSLSDLIKEGFNCDIRFIYSRPAKHLPAILGQIENYLFTLSQEWAGAQAFSSVDTLLAPFVKKDNMTYKEVEQELQQHIFNLNNKYRIAFQTPFSNYSFDLKPPEDLKNEPAIIGGVEQYFTYGDCQREMDMINKAFIEVLSQGDGLGKPFGFPIPTYSMTKDFNWDSALAQKLFEMAGKTGAPYFSNFINSDLNPSDVRSMCPLTPDTKVLVRSKLNGIRIASIKDVVIGQEIKGTWYQVWTPDGWSDVKPVKIPKTDVYEITLSNGVKVKMGENHLQPTRDNGTVKAKKLEEGMWVPFNKMAFGTDLGNYDTGFIVGAFLGDGSFDKNAIVYSLNNNTKQGVVRRVKEFWTKLGHPVTITNSSEVTFVRVNGDSKSLIARFVKGDGALSKALTNNAFNTSVEFKNGLIDGYKNTDGAKDCNRLYTSSLQLRDDLLSILSSIGKKGLAHYEDNRDGRLGTNTNYRIDFPNRDRYGTYYDSDDEYNYFSIINIEKVDYTGDYLYCFEVRNKSSLFMLANGLITHNCRLRLDLKELVRNSSGLFSSGDKTGSLGVTTLNASRMGYLNKNDIDGFYKMWDYYLNLAKESLLLKRKEVLKNMENGLLPYTKRYLGHLDNHFNTVGLIGVNECILNMFGYGIETKEGRQFALDLLDHTLYKLQDFQEETGLLFNLEATPAEGVTHRFAKHDLEDFPDIITANGKGFEYYTNSTMLPVEFTENIWEAFNHQDDLQTRYTSGTVFHIFLNEPIYNYRVIKSLIKKAFTNYKMPYITITPNIAICPVHGRLTSTPIYCPHEHSQKEIELVKNRGGEIVEFDTEN